MSQVTSPGAIAAQVTQPVSGQYQWRQPGGSPFSRAEIRLDVDGRHPLMTVSGTAYGGLATRVHWMARPLTPIATSEGVKWTGAISYREGTTFLFQYTAVQIERNGQMLRVTCTGGGPDLVQDYEFVSPFFRAVELEFDSVEGVQPVLDISTHAHPARPASIPAETLSIQEVYRRAGFDASLSGGNTTVPLAGAGANARWSDAEMHDAMQVYWSRFADRPQWALWTFLAALHEDGSSLGGIMFDDIGPNHRQGTAVFMDSFIADQPENDPSADAWVRRMRFWTTVHEMGHAFNLAHAWQKTLGNAWMPMPNGNHLLTFMNYPFRFPQGEAEFFRRFTLRFTDDELLFLRHAPEAFVQMGNANWFDNHGFEQAETPSASQLRLQIRASQATRRFDFLEPASIEITLQNTSSEPCLIPERLLESHDVLTVVVKKRNTPAHQWQPFAHYCQRSKLTVLQPGAAVSSTLLVAVGPGGWLIDTPGTYDIQLCLHLDSVDVVSNLLTVHVNPATGRDEEVLAQDYFSEEVGRVLAFNGSRHLTGANTTLRKLVELFGNRSAAIRARVVLASPGLREFKLVDFSEDPAALNGSRGRVQVIPASAEAPGLLAAALGAASESPPEASHAAANALGRQGFDGATARLVRALHTSGRPEEANRVRGVTDRALQLRHI